MCTGINAAGLSTVLLGLALAQNSGPRDVLVFERSGNQWFEGPARLGRRGAENGWFLPRRETRQLSALPVRARPACSAVGREIAYFTNRGLFVGGRAGREEPNSGAGSHSAHPSPSARTARATNSRLRKARHDYAICRAGCGGRQGHRPVPAAPSSSGISTFSRKDRCRYTGQHADPSDPGQLRNPQTSNIQK